jgi:hypothetical protein
MMTAPFKSLNAIFEGRRRAIAVLGLVGKKIDVANIALRGVAPGMFPLINCGIG